VKKATVPVKKATVPVKKATAVRKVAPVKKAAPAKKAPRVPDRVPAAAQRIERALPAVITPRAASTSPREERAKGKVAGRARHKPER
jgi:hypothetical protein